MLIARRQDAPSAVGVHEAPHQRAGRGVRSHNLHRGAAAPERDGLEQRPLRAARRGRARRSARAAARDRHVRRARHRRSLATRRRRRRTAGHRCAPARRPPGSRRTPQPPARLKPGAPTGCRTRRGDRCPRRRCTRAGARRTSRPSGRPRPRRRRSTAALPGGPQRERADRRAEPGGDRSGADEEVRYLSPRPIGARERRRRTAGRPRPGGPAPASADPGRRGERPAARLDATIEPALVPTNRRQPRTSAPVASSYPARTPVIHASPSSPPPPSTRTFGGLPSNHQASTGLTAGPHAQIEIPDVAPACAAFGSSSPIPASIPSHSTWMSGAVS